MNMQPVTGPKVTEVKTRITALQATVRQNQLDIQTKTDQHEKRRVNTTQKSRMTPAEFLLIYPSAPSTAAEDAEIASLTAQISGKPLNSLETGPARKRLDEVQIAKKIKIDDYNRNKLAPEGPLTAAQFDSLYSAPTTTAETAAISAAQTEANKLDSFLKSGPAPNAGSYDVDFLVGTAITYP